jgi:hypothetical protein
LAEQIGLKKIDVFQAGCVLEILKNGRLHIGYAIDDNKMIHCVLNEGVIIEEIKNYDVKGYYLF